MKIKKCVHADYLNSAQAEHIITLLNEYALEPMGGGAELSQNVKSNLIERLAQRTDAITIIAYDDRRPIGLLNAFEGFSTFAAAPLINIHDVYIKPEYRGKNLLNEMFNTLISIAKNRGACKLTLEVLGSNFTAKRAYEKLGFKGYELGEGAGKAEFWQLKL